MALNFQNQGSALLRRVLFAVLLVISLASMTVYAREGADGPLHRVQAVVAGAVAPARSAGAPPTAPAPRARGPPRPGSDVQAPTPSTPICSPPE